MRVKFMNCSFAGAIAQGVVCLALAAVVFGQEEPAPLPEAVKPTPVISPEQPLALPQTIDDLKTELEAFFQSEGLGENAQLSYVISNARSGEVLLEQNGRLSQTLGGLTKLYSTAAALHVLDYDYRFSTRVAYSGEFDAETGFLDGTVYLIGGGDPVLGDRLFPRADPYFPLNTFARSLKAQGVKRISGNIIGVHARYTGSSYALGWEEKNRSLPQQTEVTALSFRDASFTLQVTSKGNPGKTPKVEFFPKVSYINFNNKAVIANPGTPLLPTFFRQDETNLLSLAGQFPQSNETFVFQVPLPNPPLFAAICFRDSLRLAGIRISGDATTQSDFDEAELTGEFLQFNSPQLGELISHAYKPNNSLIAECLGREIALKKGAEPSFAGAAEAVTRWAETNGLRNQGFKLVDCSGVSPFNSASAESVAQLMYLQNGLSRNQRLFSQSLPTQNPDRNSLQGSNPEAWEKRFGKYGSRFHYITGGFENSASVAGYLNTRKGSELVVVIMIDKAISPQLTLDRMLDKIDLFYTE